MELPVVVISHKSSSWAVAVRGPDRVVFSQWHSLLANWELFLQGRFGIKKLVPCSVGWVRLGEVSVLKAGAASELDHAPEGV